MTETRSPQQNVIRTTERLSLLRVAKQINHRSTTEALHGKLEYTSNRKGSPVASVYLAARENQETREEAGKADKKNSPDR
jgi:hypothetical protein